MDEQALCAWFADRSLRDQLGHAYILQHPNRLHLQEIARALVQSLLCTKRLADGTPCGECPACVQVRSGNHTGLTWVEPDGASLKIAQMRAALRMDRHQTGPDGMHIIVLDDAGRLTAEAGNAILKWVEEPGVARLFLFLTPTQSALLPTLRSRCQLLRLDAHELLVRERWNTLRTLLGDERFADAQKLMVELTLAWAAKEVNAWQLVHSQLARLKLTGEEALHFVDTWMALLRALTTARVQGAGELEELAPGLSARAMQADAVWLAQCTLALADLRRRLQSHVSPLLAFEALLIRSTIPVGGGT